MAESLTIPTTDLDNWHLAFTDGFDTDIPLGQFPGATGGRWSGYSGLDTSDHGTYSMAKVVSVDNGVLTKYIHSADGKHYVAAILPKVGGSHVYGRYAVRWRHDLLKGYKVAWLLWPDSVSGANHLGEIDWPEKNLDAMTVGGFVHRVNGTEANQGWVKYASDNDWHTDIIEWSPDLVVFIRDGVERYRTSGAIPTTAMHWVLQTETALGGAPAPTNDVAGEVQIAWVAAWNYDTTARAPVVPKTTTISAPTTATGTAVALTATASPDVTAVRFNVGTTQVGSDDTTRPFGRTLDSTKFANGSWPLSIDGLSGGVWFDGAARTIAVSNSVKLIAPATATGVVTLGITPYPWFLQWQLQLDGNLIGSSAIPPTSFTKSWDSRTVSNGDHQLRVKYKSVFGWRDGPLTTIHVAN